MRRGFASNNDRFKRETRRFFPLLRDDNGVKTLQRGDLPVDVEHLRLEKSCAIAGDNGPIVRGYSQLDDDFRLTIEIAQLVVQRLGWDAVSWRADKFFGRAPQPFFS